MSVFPQNIKTAAKNTIAMSVPIAIGRIAGNLAGVIGMLMVAHLGHMQLAASALVNSILMAVVFSVLSIVFSVGVLVGFFYGANEFAKIGGVVQQGFILSIVLGIPTMLILWYIAPILLLFKQEPHLVTLTQDFLRGYAWGIIPNFFAATLLQFATGISKQKLVTVYNIVILPILVGFGYVLIFGKFGMPKLGMRGMGYAYSISFIVVTVVMILHFYFFKEYRQYKLFTWKKLIDFEYLRKLFDIGWPISTMLAAELLVFSMSTVLVGWLGEASLAAQQITLQINVLVIMIPYSIAMATTILISQEMGRKKHENIRLLGVVGTVLGIFGTILFAVFYLLTPKFLISFFLDVTNSANLPTIKIATTLLAIAILMNILDSVKTIFTCALRGLSDTVYPMIVNIILSCFMSLPIGYLLAFPLHMGVVGIRLGFVVGFLIGAILLMRRFYKFSDVNFLMHYKRI